MGYSFAKRSKFYKKCNSLFLICTVYYKRMESAKRSMRKHLRRRANEVVRLFCCGHCEKKFAHKCSLRRHQRAHPTVATTTTTTTTTSDDGGAPKPSCSIGSSEKEKQAKMTDVGGDTTTSMDNNSSSSILHPKKSRSLATSAAVFTKRSFSRTRSGSQVCVKINNIRGKELTYNNS